MKFDNIDKFDCAVVFYNDGRDIVVFDRTGKPVEKKPLKQHPLNNINELGTLHVGHKPNTICCVVWGGWKFCWCPEE